MTVLSSDWKVTYKISEDAMIFIRNCALTKKDFQGRHFIVPIIGKPVYTFAVRHMFTFVKTVFVKFYATATWKFERCSVIITFHRWWIWSIPIHDTSPVWVFVYVHVTSWSCWKWRWKSYHVATLNVNRMLTSSYNIYPIWWYHNLCKKARPSLISSWGVGGYNIIIII